MQGKKKPVILGLVVCTALALTASARADERETFHKTYPLSSTGLVSLNNINGEVKITAWDKNEVQLDAEKIADTREKLQRLEIRVTAGSTAIDIRTHLPGGTNNDPGRVNYTLMVPAQARISKVEDVNGSISIEGMKSSVDASTVNGRVLVSSAKGDLNLHSVNGELRASVSQLGKKATLDCVNCTIDLTVPSDSNADLAAETVHGSIRSDFDLPIDRSRFGGMTSMKAKLGSGGTLVKLNTVNGSINVHHASDGKPLSKARGYEGNHKTSYY